MSSSEQQAAKRARWREVVERQAASGLSVRAFCRHEAIREPSFYFWRRALRQHDEASDSGPAFVPAVINGETEQHAPLVLKLASGLELHLPQAVPATRLAELVRALESRGAR